MTFSPDLFQYFLKGATFKGPIYGEETQIAYEFSTWLRKRTLEENFPFVWFHVANEVSSSRNKTFGALLKACGKLPGIADYIFLGKDKCFVIELKAEKGKLSPNQKTFKEWCEINKVPCHIAYSLKECIDIVGSYEKIIVDISAEIK